MKSKLINTSILPSLKIALLYTFVSATYLYTSDYFLKLFFPKIDLYTKLQTERWLIFILITSIFLYFLIKKNIDKTAAYYNQIIDVQIQSDTLLQKSQEEYMSLFNHSPLPMWLFDIDTLQFLLVNDATCSLYGFSKTEYKKMTLRDIRPEEDIPLMEQLISQYLKYESFAFANIVRHRKKNGEIIHVKIKNSFVIFNGRKVRLASAIDVSEEMNIQKELMETNSKLKLASEIAGLGYWSYDLLTSKMQWSDEIYKIFEVDSQTFILNLETIKERLHPDDQLTYDPKAFSKIKSPSVNESERRIITDSGKLKWIFERQYLTNDENGTPIKLEGITLDVTKRKIQEQEIQESDDRFKLLAKATVEVIIDWDIKHDKVIWGEGFHSMFGYNLSVYNYHLWSSNIHPDDREKVLFDLNQTLEDPTKQYFNAEFRFLKANRDVAYIQHRGVFIRDSEGKATRALGAMIDLTDTLDRIRKIELQNNTLKDIAWIQSHVVRAPLANLLGFINLLKDNVETGLSNEKLIEYISESAKTLDNIIHDIVSKTN